MKSIPTSGKGFLLRLAAEGIGPVVGGCAGVLLAGPVGVVAGGVVGKVTEEAVKYFGPRIVEAWLAWFSRQPPSLQATALAEVGNLSPSEARQTAEEALAKVAPDATPQDYNFALEYIAAIPAAVRRSLVPDRAGGLSVPPTMAFNNGRQLLGLLPTSVPPYSPGSDLPGTPYRLTELLGTGGFGAVYKATTPTLQKLAFAIKFCLTPSLLDALKRERANLDQLHTTHAASGADKIVRLYGYDFDHATPYLVYEYVPGSDLATWLMARRSTTGQGASSREVFDLVVQITEALAFAHKRGLVHRDLKPANVLLSEGQIKLTDFGIGSVTAGYAVTHSRIGSTTIDQLDPVEQATLFRGAGTALYMSPEQRRGELADPRHDLYSLGVMWYQLLIGDVTRELHPGWADELSDDFATPPAHIDAIRACVGVLKKRPADGAKLLEMLRTSGANVPVKPEPMGAVPAQSPVVATLAVEDPATHSAAEEAIMRREELVWAIVTARYAHSKDWRLVLMVVALVFGAITSLPPIVFTILTLSLPAEQDHVVFRVLIAVFAPIAAVLLFLAFRLNASRQKRHAQANDELASLVKATHTEFSLSPVEFDTRSLTGLCQAAWGLVREIEDRYLPRKAQVKVSYPGMFGFDFAVELFVNGFLVGAGGKRRGFDLPVTLSRGTHYLELRQHDNTRWPQTFVITRDGPCRVQLGKLEGSSLTIDVVEEHA